MHGKPSCSLQRLNLLRTCQEQGEGEVNQACRKGLDFGKSGWPITSLEDLEEFYLIFSNL